MSFKIVWKITFFVLGIPDGVTLLHLTAELLLVEEESLPQVDVAIVEDDHRDKEEGDELPPAKVANVAGEHRVVGALKRNARKSTQKKGNAVTSHFRAEWIPQWALGILRASSGLVIYEQ